MPAASREGAHAGRGPRRGHVRREQRRLALLADLAAIARRLSDDELRVLLTIGVRAWIGQALYGCLRLAGDRRDFRGEAFEEACDAAFYLAAALLRPRWTGSRHRGRRRALLGDRQH